MIDRSNYLFTQVRDVIATTQLKGSSMTLEDGVPTKLPYMFFNIIGNEQAADDLDNTENAVNTTIEITFYATGTSRLNTCKNLMSAASDKMRSMGFRRVYGPAQILNVSNTDICRYLARFNRIIGSGDTI